MLGWSTNKDNAMDVLRLTVKIHRVKGVSIECSDAHQTAVTQATGNTYKDRRALGAVLSRIGEEIQRAKLDRWKSAPGTPDVVILTIADTQAARDEFGTRMLATKRVRERHWRRYAMRIRRWWASH
jgi:hypothetical protein